MAIGVAVANALKAPPLVMFSCAVVGSIGYSMGASIAVGDAIINYTAGPAGAYIAAIVAAEQDVWPAAGRNCSGRRIS